MKIESIEKDLICIIKEIKPSVNEKKICDDTNLMNDINLDSLDFMRLVIDIEERFMIDIDPLKLTEENLKTFINLKKLISSYAENYKE